MSNINVVIADDNERIRQNLQEIVSRECDMTLVGSASDGMDALSMIRTSHPDVVLLDIIMPKMDGLGVLEEVKKDENLLKKPAFIILTAMGQEEEKKIREAAFAGYQVNKELMAVTNKDCMVLHCLPAHRGEEITADVFEEHANEIFEEAENRLHAQKAVLVECMADEMPEKV